MGKFLRVLVVFFLLFASATLAFGVMLFLKRELLKARTQRLEKTLKALDAFVETEPGAHEEQPTYTEKDMSPCTTEVLAPDQIDFNNYWEGFSHDLEIQEPKSMLNTSSRDQELMTYYARDELGEKILDPSQQFYVTTGEGTMDVVMKDILAAAAAQYELLNTTRQQLTDLRIVLIETIELYNTKKDHHRRALKKIKELEEEIARLLAEIARLKDVIADLEMQIVNLKDIIAEKEREIALKEEEIGDLNAEIDRLKTLIPEMLGEMDTDYRKIEPGNKGKVLSVNAEWNFVVIKCDPQLMTELLGSTLDRQLPPNAFLWVKREGYPTSPIAKLRVVQAKADEGLLTADILSDWEQAPVKPGDIVFY
jgi:hypothetical protein